MKEINCRLCTSDQFTVIAQKNSNGYIFPIVRCKSCGLLYSRLQPSNDEFKTIYEGFDCAHEKQWGHLQDHFNANVIERVRKYSSFHRKWLDLGSGTGKFLTNVQRIMASK